MYIDGLMFGIIYVLCLCVGSGCGENVYVIVRYCRHLVDQTTYVTKCVKYVKIDHDDQNQKSVSTLHD